MPAAVTEIVLGAGMSTAMYGSMLGNHSFDAISQPIMTTASNTRLGRKARTRSVRRRIRTPNDRTADEAGVDASLPDGASVASGPLTGATSLPRWKCQPSRITVPTRGCLDVTLRHLRPVGLAGKRPRPRQIVGFRPGLRLPERGDVRVGRIR